MADPMGVARRAAHRLPKLRALLHNDKPARIHSRPGRTVDNRASLQRAYDAAELTLREHEVRGLAKALAARDDAKGNT